AKGALRFDAKLDLSGADLRPGGQLNKGPGQVCNLSASGTYRPVHGGMKLDVTALEIRALDDSLTGTAQFETAPRNTTFAAARSGPRLNADALLLQSEPEPPASPSTRPGASAVAAATDVHRFDGYHGEVDVKLGAARYKETDFRDVHLALKM